MGYWSIVDYSNFRDVHFTHMNAIITLTIFTEKPPTNFHDQEFYAYQLGCCHGKRVFSKASSKQIISSSAFERTFNTLCPKELFFHLANNLQNVIFYLILTMLTICDPTLFRQDAEPLCDNFPLIY